MIFDLFFGIVYYFLVAITSPLRLLPDVTVDSNVVSALTTASSYLYNLNIFVPLTTFITVLGLIIAVEVLLNVYKVIMWVIKRIPGQG